MKVVVDKDIPFLSGVLEPYFKEVVYLSGKDISPEDVADACAMVIRTRTKCNEKLLKDSSVKFIATATIGTDHIDMEYCRRAGIVVKNAAGCNAAGVMQYVFTALYGVASKKSIPLTGEITLGVIGVGNVGSRVAAMGEYMGFNVLRCDPAKEKEAGADAASYCTLEYLLKNSDIVTMHTDLNPTSRDMAGVEFFRSMKDGAIFINSSRGEVVQEDALLASIGKLSAVIIDVWRNEPAINKELMEKADIATPHIAGYSYEGKVNGTVMSVRALAGFYDIAPLKTFVIEPQEKNTNSFSKDGLSQIQIAEYFGNIFPIFEHCADLKTHPQNFEQLRSNFKYRREFYVNSTTKTTNC